MSEKMEVPIKKFIEDLNKYCELKATCEDCPTELSECCEILSSFDDMKKIVDAIYPKTFGEELLEQFPNMNFNGVCFSRFFGKQVPNHVCSKYKNCKEHFMSCTREELLKELE